MTEEREKKWPEYIYWSALPVLFLLVLLVGVPDVEARQDTWQVIGLRVDHHFPDAQVPVGQVFYAGAEAHAETQPIDTVMWDDFRVSEGCTLLDLTFSNATLDDVSAWLATFEMHGPVCTWSARATGIDGGLIAGDEEAYVYVTGSVSAFTLTDFGQETDKSLANDGAWLLVFSLLLLFSMYYGSGLIWLLPIVSATIGFFSSLYGEVFPVSPTGALTLYVLAVLLVWYQSRKLERSVK